MEKFNVGDKVRHKVLGVIGKIVEIKSLEPDRLGIEVKLDKRNAVYGDVFYCSPSGIELVSRRKESDYVKVIINPPAVILFRNGKKYVAKAQDEPFNAERGLMVALLKSFGIGYSDIQEMLKWAKYQKNISIGKTVYDLSMIDEINQEIKEKRSRPMKTVDIIQDIEKYMDDVRKPIDQDLVYAEMMSREDEEHAKKYIEMLVRPNQKYDEELRKGTPKSKRGRPRKFKVGDEVVIKNDIYNKLYEITEKIEFDTSINLHLRDVRTDEERWANSRNVELVEKASDKGKK